MLLDTHTLIWFLENDTKLPEDTRNTIETTEKICVSIVILWEMAIKVNINKLKLGYEFSDLPTLLNQLNIQILDITFSDLDIYTALPLHHRDPFDRLIITQAQNRSLAIISKDENFNKYSLPILWG
ncbi:MAG: type II toxin-antitoxin system VapC family toxin [Limnothrix sp. RL_2_0]|nr:type II toxin-antitoxin system VapC family toxin [Limnothrix sp. RL_2_0]